MDMNQTPAFPFQAGKRTGRLSLRSSQDEDDTEGTGPCLGPHLWSGSAHRALPPSPTDENKSTRTSPAWGGKVADLSKEKGQEPVPQWALIGFSLHWGIQVKLISHCQAVRIKQ